MIEAIACGTPVVAFRCGSVPEVIEDGISGLIVSSIDEAVEAARHVQKLNRLLVRRAFERRFTAEAMARAYLDIYRGLPGAKTGALPIGRTNRLFSEVESNIVFLEQKGREHHSVRFEPDLPANESKISLTCSRRKLPRSRSDTWSAGARNVQQDEPHSVCSSDGRAGLPASVNR